MFFYLYRLDVLAVWIIGKTLFLIISLALLIYKVQISVNALQH